MFLILVVQYLIIGEQNSFRTQQNTEKIPDRSIRLKSNFIPRANDDNCLVVTTTTDEKIDWSQYINATSQPTCISIFNSAVISVGVEYTEPVINCPAVTKLELLTSTFSTIIADTFIKTSAGAMVEVQSCCFVGVHINDKNFPFSNFRMSTFLYNGFNFQNTHSSPVFDDINCSYNPQISMQTATTIGLHRLSSKSTTLSFSGDSVVHQIDQLFLGSSTFTFSGKTNWTITRLYTSGSMNFQNNGVKTTVELIGCVLQSRPSQNFLILTGTEIRGLWPYEPFWGSGLSLGPCNGRVNGATPMPTVSLSPGTITAISFSFIGGVALGVLVFVAFYHGIKYLAIAIKTKKDRNRDVFKDL